MALLLVSLRTDRAGHVPGEVVTVLPDVSKVGTLDRQDTLILDVPGGVTQLSGVYLQSGVPQNLLDAEQATRAAWTEARAGLRATPPTATQADVDAAEAAMLAADAAARPSLFSARKRTIDLAQIPLAVLNRIKAKRAKIAEFRAAADAEGHRRFMAFVRLRFGPLTAEEEARSQREWLEMLARRWARAKAEGASEQVLGRLDAIGDRLRKEAHDGEQAILTPELNALPNAAIPTLTLAQLDAVTVTNG